MTDVMTKNGFCELNDNEMLDVDGGRGFFETIGYGAGKVLYYYCKGLSVMEDYGA